MNRTVRGVAFAVAAGLSSAASAQGIPNWYEAPSLQAPVRRWSFDWALDEARSQIVMFGGGEFFYQDTWTYDGIDWVERSPAVRPTPRNGHSMCYDRVRDRVVLFGGFSNSVGRLNDTWEWDGSVWVQRTPPVSPPVRSDADLVYDPVRQRTILFGGEHDGSARGDMWLWDGVTWTQALPATLPPPMSGHDMAWDPLRQRVVLVTFRAPLFACEVWEWDGTSWTQRSFASGPPPRRSTSIAHDPEFGGVVLYGGLQVAQPYYLIDLWRWDGMNWTEIVTSSRPLALSQHEMVHMPSLRSLVMWGGAYSDGTGGAYASDRMWIANQLVHPPDTVKMGQSCRTSGGVPVLRPTALPWLGASLRVELKDAPAGSIWFLMLGMSSTQYWHLRLPAELSSLLMPNCWLYTSVDSSELLSTGTGTTTWSGAIPNLLPLRGMPLYAQALIHSPGSNPRGFATSWAVRFRIGSTL